MQLYFDIIILFAIAHGQIDYKRFLDKIKKGFTFIWLGLA